MGVQQWVCQFRDCPDVEDVEVLVEQEGRPMQVVRTRPGAGGRVDGYVLQRADIERRTALYTWIRADERDLVAADLLELLAECCPAEGAR
ncbi:hypothetical protein [Kitasatospora sp. NBC_00315]|uniref:hypothetical protein n=1 Tax=Kitasatospora sp. NBC_00315 TaxID=2975963 RepID=UPI0032557273